MSAEKPNICGKRNFRSRGFALQANRSARFRIRLYFCRICAGWHATNGDKR